MAGAYVYSGAFIPGMLARAEAEATEFTAVQQGFALLAVQGTDSGSANAYVIATAGGQDGIYTDGMAVEFKAANANTGACTISVDGGAVVSLTNFSGQSLTGGAISANTWYICRYNSSYSAFTLIAPTSLVTTSNTISGAPPTYKVGLTAAGGVSTACVPIDAVYALDQSIAPTWTGAHTFSNAVSFLSTVTFATGLTLMGGSGSYAFTADGSSSLGNSYGLEINAGTNGSDVAFLVNNQAGSTVFFKITGAGGVTVGSPTGGSQGLGTINAAGLYVNGVAVLTSSASGANPTASVGLTAVNGSASTFMRSDGAPALSQAIAPTWTGQHTFAISSAATAVVISNAVNQIGLKVQALNANTSNQYLVEFIANTGAGFSSGLLMQAGTSSSDYNTRLKTSAGTDLFAILGNGEAYVYEVPANTGLSGCHQVGYMELPLHSLSGTLAMTDRGKFISATGNITIPANSSVAYPVGTTILVFASGANRTISITTDTLTWLPSAATGSRTLAQNSVATLYKAASTTWYIWGFGLT